MQKDVVVTLSIKEAQELVEELKTTIKSAKTGRVPRATVVLRFDSFESDSPIVDLSQSFKRR